MDASPRWPGKEDPWEGVEVNLGALQKIVCEVLRVPLAMCGPPTLICGGDEEECCYTPRSRVYIFELPSRCVVARLVIPIKPLFKMEAEIAAMDFVRSHTTLPIPNVFTYCSEADNPVGAEWMIMEHARGMKLSSVWNNLSPSQKQTLARDIIDIPSQLSRLKATGSGSIYHVAHSVDDINLYARTPRWRPLSAHLLKLLRKHCTHPLKDGFMLGPAQSVALLNFLGPVPTPEQTLPVYTIDDYLSLVIRNGRPTAWSDYELWPRQACLDLIRVLRNLYPHSRLFGPLADGAGFYFAHGDLHDDNIFVDPETGSITAMIDWECATFAPMWVGLAGMGWFGEDIHRMICGSNDPENFNGETETDARLRALFRTLLNARDSDLFTCFLGGSDFRAICGAAADGPSYYRHTEVFVRNYQELGYWNESRRGPFPWDMNAWLHELIDREEDQMRKEQHLKMPQQAEQVNSTTHDL